MGFAALYPSYEPSNKSSVSSPGYDRAIQYSRGGSARTETSLEYWIPRFRGE
jgi:hypothetical protein